MTTEVKVIVKPKEGTGSLFHYQDANVSYDSKGLHIEGTYSHEALEPELVKPSSLIEWREGHPAEKELEAHSSRLWLVKHLQEKPDILTLLPYEERVKGSSAYVVANERYSDYDDQILFKKESDRMVHLKEDGMIEIVDYSYDYGRVVYEGWLTFWGGLISKPWCENMQSHAELVVAKLKEEGRIHTNYQKIYAHYQNHKFCPIDEEGNKVPWPK